MRIGLNLLFLKPKLAGGTETYSYGLLKGLAEESTTANTFFIFCSYDLDLDFLKGKSNFKIIKYNIGSSVSYRCWYEQFVFPFKLKKYKLDVLHSLGYIGPIKAKNHLVTIHDANAFVHTDMNLVKKFFLSSLMKLTAKNCTAIIAVSLFSKQEIIKYLNVAAEKITVVYEACKFTGIRKDYTLPGKFDFLNNENFFVGLSSTYKNKNIPTLIDAFKIISEQYPEIKLLLIGYLPLDNGLQHQIKALNLSDKIISTGYVIEEELVALFQKSIAFIFPSLYEGFGLPLLEAQNIGVPVVSSDRGSLPEIGKDSVIYFDALNAEDLSIKMAAVYKDAGLRRSLIEKGFINTTRFSWNAAANQMLALYNNLNNN